MTLDADTVLDVHLGLEDELLIDYLNGTELGTFHGFEIWYTDTQNGDFNGENWWYPLVNIQKAIENGHWNSEFSHEKWWFSIAMLVYQRVMGLN